MRLGRTTVLMLAAGLLAGCSGGDDDDTSSGDSLADAAISAVPTTAPAAPPTTATPTTSAAAAEQVPTTATPTTSAAAAEPPPTTGAPTTEAPSSSDAASPPEDADAIADSVLAYFTSEVTDKALVAMSPDSGAAAYFGGLLVLGDEGGDPVAGRVVDGGIVLDDSSGPTIDEFVFDAEGRLADFSRNGVPVSTSVAVLDQQFVAGPATGTVHSVRDFDDTVQVIFSVTNTGSTGIATLDFDQYVAAGQQSGVSSLSNYADARPAATVAAIYGWEGQAAGGTVYGTLYWTSDDGMKSVNLPVDVTIPKLG